MTVATMALGLAAPAAHAHGAQGQMTITKLEQTGPRTVHLEVGIVFGNDNDPAEGATVTATFTGPASVPPAPVPKLRSALYATDVTLPAAGAWTVAVASTNPTASATGTVQVTDAANTTTSATTSTTASTGPSITTSSTSPSTSADSTGSSAAPTPTATSATTVTPAVDQPASSGGDGANPALLLGVIVIIVALAGGGVLLAARRRGSQAP
jgi:hypothetical protein